MLGRSNLLAVVGGGQAPKFPDRNGMCICTSICNSYFIPITLQLPIGAKAFVDMWFSSSSVYPHERLETVHVS